MSSVTVKIGLSPARPSRHFLTEEKKIFAAGSIMSQLFFHDFAGNFQYNDRQARDFLCVDL